MCVCVCVCMFRERGRERDREAEKHEHVRETSIGCLSHMPQLGTRPGTQAYALSWNWTGDLLLCGMTLDQLSHVGQVPVYFFSHIFFYILFNFLKIFIPDFRERGRKGKREGKKHPCEREALIGCLSYTPWLGTKPATQAHALIGNWTGDHLVCGTMTNWGAPDRLLSHSKYEVKDFETLKKYHWITLHHLSLGSVSLQCMVFNIYLCSIEYILHWRCCCSGISVIWPRAHSMTFQ